MKQNHLPLGGIEELQKRYLSMLEPKTNYRILDIGFGTGTLSLLTAAHIKNELGNKKLVLYGIDNDKYLMDYLHQLPKHDILPNEHKILESLAKRRAFEQNKLKIRLIDQDIKKAIKNIPEGFDYAFFDMFGPSEQEHIWSQELFQELYAKLNPDGKLATHTSSTDVRINLTRAGFQVTDGPEIYPGIRGTIAHKRK